MTAHWTLSAATILSLSALAASPQAASGGELLGIWIVPIVVGVYGVGRTILMRYDR